MSQTRQLATVLFADIVGYTALMQKNEEAALEKIHLFKEQLTRGTEQSRGEIIQYYGDGCLVTFSSSADAVECAKGLQEVFGSLQVPVKIGIHLGDIMKEGDNIFGDSVNISSRIESMGVAGSILFSEAVRNQIKNKPGFNIISLGKFEFKNVEEPVEVFALANPGLVVPERTALQGKFKENKKKSLDPVRWWKISLAGLLFTGLAIAVYFLLFDRKPEDSRKSVAVLSFTDMSPDKSQEHLGDGLADDIITSLSGIKDLKVTGRTSSFQFKGKNIDLREIGDKLDVGAVLEGSVQKSGNRLRVTAQLINTEDGSHIWSHKWDREIIDIFRIQDEISTAIAEKLQVTFLKKPGKGPTAVNPEAYELFLQGRLFLHSGRPLNVLKAKEFLLRAKNKDSTYAPTWAYLSVAYRTLLSSFPPAETEKIRLLKDSVRFFAEKSIQLDPECSSGYIALANVYSNLFNYIEVDKLTRRAIELNPGAEEKNRLAILLMNMGYPEETFQLLREAMKLEPLSPQIKSTYLNALMRYKKFDVAEKTAREYLDADSANISYWSILAFVYVGKKQYTKALQAWARQHESYGNKELAQIYRTSDFKTAMSAWIEQSRTNKALSSTDMVRAIAFAMRGDKDSTLSHLELAVANNENNVAHIKNFWVFDLVRNEPRFRALYQFLKFDAYDTYRRQSGP